MKDKVLLFLLLTILIFSLNPNVVYLIALFGFLTYLFLPSQKYWDKTSLWLMLFSVFYCLIIYLNDNIGSVFEFFTYIICPIGFYRTGQYFTEKVNSPKMFLMIWSIIIFCYSIPLSFDTFDSINRIGIVNPFRTMGSEGNSYKLSATLYGLHASLGLSAVSIFFSTLNDTKYFKVLYIFAGIVSLLTVIHLVNRTGLVVVTICLIGCMLYIGVMNKKHLIFSIVSVCILYYILIYGDFIDSTILDAYLDREENAIGSSTLEVGGRSSLWLNAIENIISNPFGFHKEKYSHNLWLDIARVAGILPFICFLLASLLNYKSLYKIIKGQESAITPILLSINIAMFLSSFVEPVIEGSSLYFYLLMFLWGCNERIMYTNYYNYNIRN